MVTKRQIMAALRKAIDPETGISLVDMGLIKDIQIKGAAVKIRITLTSPFCPFAGYMAEDVRRRAGAVKGVKRVLVEVAYAKA
jgi:metal-sulfur cluster biosynthetic enzyme